MYSIFISILDFFLLLTCIIFLQDILYHEQNLLSKCKRVFVLFLITLVICLVCNQQVPMSIASILFLFLLNLFIQKKISLVLCKRFVFTYIYLFVIVAFLSNVTTVLHVFSNTLIYIIILCCMLLFKQFRISKMRVFVSRKMRIISLIVSCLLSAYFVHIHATLIYPQQIYTYDFMYSVIMVVVLFIFIVLYIKEWYYKMFEKKQNEDYAIINLMQKQYIEDLLLQDKEMRKFNHDYRAQLFTLQYLIQENNTQDVKEYLAQLQSPTQTKKSYCSHLLLDSIFHYFDTQYSDVSLYVEDGIQGELSIPTQRMSSLLYNLMANAYEASELLIQAHIRVVLKSESTNLYVQIQNSVSKEFSINAIEQHKTSKQDAKNHGIGLFVIQDIVKTYHGVNTYTLQENTLYNDIVLFDVIK